MKREITTDYWLGDIVYLRVNDEPVRGMVTGVRASLNGAISYGISWRGGTETYHYAGELTSEFIPEFLVDAKVGQ